MNKEFYKHIFDKQKGIDAVPSNTIISSWTDELINLLYPEKSEQLPESPLEIELKFNTLGEQLIRILNATKACGDSDNQEKSKQFFNNIPEMYRVLNTDVDAIVAGDPAARAKSEVIRAYPGFYAI